MSIWSVIMIGLLAVSVILLLITIWYKKKQVKVGKGREVDYRAFFIMGITFLPLGIVLVFVVENPGFIGFMGLGAAYIAIGLANRDKWKTA